MRSSAPPSCSGGRLLFWRYQRLCLVVVGSCLVVMELVNRGDAANARQTRANSGIACARVVQIVTMSQPSLSVAEAAHHLGVSEATIRRWVHKGLLPAYRTPTGRFRFTQHDLDAVITPEAS